MSMTRLAELPDVMTVAEAAAFLRLGRNTVYEAVRRNELPSVRVGRRLLVPRVGLERFLTTTRELSHD